MIPKIVLLITLAEKEFLIDSFKNESFNTAIFDGKDLKDVFWAKSPRNEFLNRLIDQINIAALSPFRIAGPVRDMFYGRKNERQIIMNSFLRPGARNFAVIGPRRIGKTSLLIRMQEEIENKKGFHGIFLDSMPYGKDIQAWYNAILRKLNIQKESSGISHFIDSIDDYCHKNKYTLVLCLDEVDDFLQADKKNDYIFFKTLRALINEADVKLLIAGYKTLYFQMKDRESPLFNMFEPIELSSLDQDSAIALIEEPLRNIYSIKSSDIMEILNKTGCYPNFIQFCCQKLVEFPNVSKTRTITNDDITTVTTSQVFYEFVIDVYLQNLDEKSKTILYLMMCHFDPQLGKFISDRAKYSQSIKSGYADKRKKYEIGATFTPYEIHRILEINTTSLSDSELEIVMKTLVLASILKHKEGREYSFILSDLPEILRKHVEIEESTVNLLEKAEIIFEKKG